MIVSAIMDLLKFLVTTVFGVLPNIPNFAVELQTSLNTVLDTIFNNLSLLGCFIRPMTIKLIIPILLVIWNFEKIYEVTMWIIKKIPFFGVE